VFPVKVLPEVRSQSKGLLALAKEQNPPSPSLLPSSKSHLKGTQLTEGVSVGCGEGGSVGPLVGGKDGWEEGFGVVLGFGVGAHEGEKVGRLEVVGWGVGLGEGTAVGREEGKEVGL
jgi:hypothetical protein